MLWWKVQRLKSRDPQVRCGIVEEMVATGSPTVVEHVIEALNDEDHTVRATAAKGLGTLHDERGLTPLVNALRDRKSEVRATAAQSLRRLGDGRAITALTNALGDIDHNVRWHAAATLNALGWQPSSDTEFVLRSVALGQHDAAAVHGKNSVQVLVAALEDTTCPKRHEIALALGKTGDPRAARALENALKDGDSHVRVAAVEALANLGASHAANALLRSLKDNDPRVRSACIEALGRMGDPRIIEPINTSLLQDSSWDVRKLSVEALSRIRDDRTAPLLCLALHDKDHDVRQAAAAALGQTADSRAIGPLVLALKDENSAVRQSAKASLRQIDRQWEISASAEKVIPELEAAVNHHEYWVAQSAADTLTKINDARQRAANLGTLADPGKERTRVAIDILSGTLHDDDRDLRQAAAEALGRIGDHRVVPPLVAALDDEDEWVGRAAALALNHLNWEPAADDTRRAERLKTLMLQPA